MTRGKQKIEAQKKNAEKNQKSKGSQLEARAVGLKVVCPICKVKFLSLPLFFHFPLRFFFGHDIFFMQISRFNMLILLLNKMIKSGCDRPKFKCSSLIVLWLGVRVCEGIHDEFTYPIVKLVLSIFFFYRKENDGVPNQLECTSMQQRCQEFSKGIPKKNV